MPSRSRPGPPEVEEDSGLRSLSFNQPLSWRVGRSAIPIADLLERLQTLAQELRKLDQEEIDKESLRKVSQELASGNLLAHKDKGVRAWATCCIVDVLRLCAPDAPFTRNQLKVGTLKRHKICVLSLRSRNVLTEPDLGYIHMYRVLDNPRFSRPIQRLQCPAYLRPGISCRGEECGFDGRS